MRIGGVLFGLISALAVGEASAAAEFPQIEGFYFVRIVFSLLAVIALLFAVAYFLRKLSFGKAFGQKGPMRVVGGLMLGARERIVLVEIGETLLVVGIIPGQIKTLHTLPKGDVSISEENDPAFGKWLKQIAERKHENE